MNGLLVDVTRCTGCERCVAACVEANELDPLAAQRDRAITADGLSANRLVSVVQVQDRFARKSCMHCLEPACVSACLVGGITRSPEGPVVYDPDKCIGCRYCMLACPFHVPRYEWDDTAPLMAKCAFCFQRLEGGELPACAEACPEDALTFGDRDRLLVDAHQRIDTSPGRYLPRVWGEHEFGGTAVLYVSDVDLSPLGWPGEEAPPIPSLTQPLIEKTPAIGLSVASCLVGLNWVIRRRMRLAGGAGDADGHHAGEKAGRHA
jgi:formate dehydrogenase iron-sulfur subunit